MAGEPHERDPALERAWREHSREAPPPALDRAILAAAHRAAGSRPMDAGRAEATRPQRWWMPLAAAATIGAVAIGIMQTTPEDEIVAPPTSQVASAPPPTTQMESPPPRAASEPAPANAPVDETKRRAASVEQKLAADSAGQDKKQVVPAPGERVASAAAGKRDGAPAPRTGADVLAPQPFPAAPELRQKTEVARSMDAAPGRANEADARKDMAAERQQPTATTSAVAPAVPPPPAAAALSPAPAPAAAPASQPMRMREAESVRGELGASGIAAPAQLAKKNAAADAFAEKARDPDAWIAQIRKLHDEGRPAEALRELREFRDRVPDADKRLPADLLAWANTFKP